MHRAASLAAAISERPVSPRRCAMAAAPAAPTRLSNGQNALGSSPTFPRAEKFLDALPVLSAGIVSEAT